MADEVDKPKQTVTYNKTKEENVETVRDLQEEKEDFENQLVWTNEQPSD